MVEICSMKQPFTAVPQSLSLLFAKKTILPNPQLQIFLYIHTFKTPTPSGTLEMIDKRIPPETGVESEVQFSVQSPFQEMLPQDPV
jgi:hypothetical protein